jgi:PAS domain S-box-containing protein
MTIASDGLGLRDRTTAFLSLLPPRGKDRRLVVAMIAASAVVFVVLAPFAKAPLAPVLAFIPAYQSALFMSDAITAAILFGQFSIQRTRALLLLATAYLFTAVAIVPHTLSFPGLFAPAGLMGSGPQTTVWLYMLWHAGFPLLVIAYSFAKQDDRPLGAPLASALWAAAAAIAVVVGFTLLTTVGHSLLPTLLLADNSYTPAMLAVIFGVWALSIVAVAVVWRRTPHTALDLWMMVVLVAWACDIGLSAALNAKRFDLGFYAGRGFGLAASSFVMIMLVLETRGLYARLARSLDIDRVVAENRANAAQRVSHETAETLRAVVDSSSLAVVALSPQGKVLLWNKTAERLFGHAAPDVLGKPYPLLPREPQVRKEQRALFARIVAGATLRDIDLHCRLRNGTVIAMRGSAAPFHDATGELRGVAFALEDLTEKIATEAMLRQSQKMEAVGQLTGGMAHDFNNILMVILANVEEMQEDETLPAHHRARLASIATSGERAAELTRRLLAFSRKQRLQPQNSNLTDLVAGFDKLLRRTLGEQIEIEAILADGLWITNVDRAQVEAALINLCVNARDAMPNGGKLLIETANVELDEDYAAANAGVAPGQYVMLAVGDTGTGMSRGTLEKAFEPFFTTKDVGKGTGLGLSMIYGFVRQSNGHIKIYSELGVGTTVRIYLPRSNASSAEETAGAAAIMPRGSERILLVEDDPQVRATVQAQLNGLGYAVTATACGAEALGRLDRGEAFDAVLSDVVMPGMSGPELAEAIAARRLSPRVLFMSGYSEHATRLRGNVAADAPLLSKPFRKIDLAERLRETLDKR